MRGAQFKPEANQNNQKLSKHFQIETKKWDIIIFPKEVIIMWKPKIKFL